MHASRRTGRFLIAAFWAAALGPTAQAIELSPPLLLSTDLSADAGGVRVAYNSTEAEYVAVWSYITGNIRQIGGQRFSPGGGAIGGNVDLSQGPGTDTDPRIAYNSLDNQYLLTVRAQPDLMGPSNEGAGQRLSADLQFIGSEIAVGDPTFEPSLLYNPDIHEYFYTAREFSNGSRILSQRISTGGNLVGPAARLDLGAIDGSTRAPNGNVVLNSAEDEYFAVWRKQGDGVLSVEGRRIEENNSPANLPVEIAAAGFNVGVPAFLAMEAALNPNANQYLIAYNRLGAVRGQFVGADGIPSGNEHLLFNTSNENIFSLAFDSVHDVYLLAAVRNSTELIVQQLSPTGTPLGGPIPIALAPTSIDDTQVVFNAEQGRFVVAWTAQVAQGNRNVFARFVSVPEPLTIGLVAWCVFAKTPTRGRRRVWAR